MAFGIDDEVEEGDKKSGVDADMTPITPKGGESSESFKAEEEEKEGKPIDASEESSESSGLGIQSNENSFQVSDVDEESKEEEIPTRKIADPLQDSGQKKSLFSSPSQHRHKVQFEDEKEYKHVDLPTLIKTKNEIIYRLSELYLPKNES